MDEVSRCSWAEFVSGLWSVIFSEKGEVDRSGVCVCVVPLAEADKQLTTYIRTHLPSSEAIINLTNKQRAALLRAGPESGYKVIPVEEVSFRDLSGRYLLPEDIQG